MVKFSHERENPEYIRQRTLENTAEKMKQILGHEGFKITPLAEKKMNDIARDIKRETGLEIPKDEILKSALEATYFDQGGWPEKLQEKYINLIIAQIENKIAAGEELYKAIGEILVELKRRGIEIDSKRVEEKLREKI